MKGILTSICYQYTEQHYRVCSSTLMTSLNRTHNRGDNHINHENSQYNSGQLIFPFCSTAHFRQIKVEVDVFWCRTHADGLFPMENRKQATIKEAMIYWRE